MTFYCSHFKEVHLYDIHVDDVNDGVQSQNLSSEDLSKIRIHHGFDFINKDVDFYDNIDQLMKSGTSIKKIIKELRKQVKNLNYETPLSNVDRKFDLSISFGVHSQLFSRLFKIFENNIESYTRKDLLALNDEVKYLSGIGVKLYNEFLYNTLNKGGILYAGFDILELSTLRKNFILKPHVAHLIQAGNVLDHLNNLVKEAGVMGAYEGYLDLSTYRSNEDEIVPTNFWLWDYFDFQSYFFITKGIYKK